MAKNKIISDRLNTFFTNNKMTVGESIPATGTWSKGDIVISTIQANGECGWICVEAGTPGRWEIFGAGGGGSLIAINASEIVNNSVTEVSLSGLGVSVSPSDKLLVHYNSTHLFEGVDFEIVEEGTKIRKLGGGSWNESNEPNILFAFELLKAVKSIDGDKISIDTKMVELKNNVNITSPVSEVTIGIEGFNKSSDVLTVYKNSTYMIEGVDYNIDETSKKIISLKGNWNQSNESEYMFTFVVLKEVSDITPNASVNTDNIVNGSVTLEKLADNVRQAILDVGNIDLTTYATKVDMGDKNNLQTSIKTNLVAAINEVFQCANNGKITIASVVGSPLNSDDTFNAMGTKLQGIKDKFKLKLNDLDIDTNSINSFDGLVDLIETVEKNNMPVWFVTKDTYVRAADMNYKRRYQIAEYYDGKIYAFGGMEENIEKKEGICFDITANKWVNIASMPTQNCYSGSRIINDKMYIYGGVVNGSKVYSYDPVLNSFTNLSNLPDTWERGSAELYDNKVHLMGGYGRNKDTKHYVHDVQTDTYTTEKELPYKATNHSSVISGEEIYIMGGTLTASAEYSCVVGSYNTITKTWTRKNNSPVSLDGSEAVVIDGNVYVFITTYAYKYIFSTDSWVKIQTDSGSFHYSTVVTDGKHAYILGGSTSYGSTLLRCYIP